MQPSQPQKPERAHWGQSLQEPRSIALRIQGARIAGRSALMQQVARIDADFGPNSVRCRAGIMNNLAKASL